MMKFTDLDEAIQIDGFTLTASTVHDDSMGAPWEEHDGHGEVTDWTRRDKAPGELILSDDGGSKRFYDFQGACEKARAEGWGPAAHSLTFEQGSNGLCRATAHWFAVREPHGSTSWRARGGWQWLILVVGGCLKQKKS